jgi:hypothetical protein
MYPVSEEYKDSVLAQIRKVTGKVQIDFTDPFIDQSITVTTSENANVSYPNQTADTAVNPVGKIASLDGSWVLGEYVLAPNPDQSRYSQMGWWGSQLSSTGGEFSPPYPSIAVEFAGRPIDTLKVVGDNARMEYPVDFEINLYDETDTVLHTESVTGNAEVSWSKTLPSTVTGVTKMDLTITKWSHEGRQVKILEFFTSLQRIFESDDILKIKLLEEREVGQNNLPIGTISAAELEIQLNNELREFDAHNEHSPLYQTVKANRRIKAWLGVEKEDKTVEYVPLGVFWSGDWDVPEDDLYAKTVGRDRLEMLMQTTYTTSVVKQDVTLYELAQDVLIDAGLTPDDYWIDPDLENFIVPYGYFAPQSHREALRKIAEAGLGQVYCDRNGVIRIEGASYLEFQINSVIEITPEDYFRKNNPVRVIANQIEVETQPLIVGSVEEICTVTDSGDKTLTLNYNSVPCINVSANITGGTITDAIYYAWGAVVTVSAVGEFTITLSGQPLKVGNKVLIAKQNDESIKDVGLKSFRFPVNPLVQTPLIAETIADILLTHYSTSARDLELEWRGDPAILLGDRITVTDNNGSADYYVIKQELDFTGALRAKLSGKKV